MYYREDQFVASKIDEFGCLELINQPLYDSVEILPGVTSSTFFDIPVGVSGKWYGDTNMQYSECLHACQSFWVNGFAISGDIPETFLNEGVFEFIIDNKTYLIMSPLSLFHRKNLSVLFTDNIAQNNYIPFKLSYGLGLSRGNKFYSVLRFPEQLKTFKVRVEICGNLYRPLI